MCTIFLHMLHKEEWRAPKDIYFYYMFVIKTHSFFGDLIGLRGSKKPKLDKINSSWIRAYFFSFNLEALSTRPQCILLQFSEPQNGKPWRRMLSQQPRGK